MDAALKRRRGAAGFTLIELMIVVAVLALLTTTVSLSVSRPRAQGGTDWARFEAVHDRLRQEAVLSRQVLGLEVTTDGYRRLIRRDGDWQAVGEEIGWRGSAALLAPFDGPVVFGPSGQSTPVRLRFEGGDGARLCTGNGWVEVTCGAG